MMKKGKTSLPPEWKLAGGGTANTELMLTQLGRFGISTDEGQSLILSLIKNDVPIVGFQDKITPETYLRAFWFMAMTATNERCRIQALEAGAKIQNYIGAAQRSVEIDLVMPGVDEKPIEVRVVKAEEEADPSISAERETNGEAKEAGSS